MDAIILSVGTELVTGQSLDTNSAWLAARLIDRGVRVVEHRTVGDELERLTAAIRESLDRAECVILTGGLGPTLDDLSREAIAAAVCAPLAENPDALGQLEAFFKRIHRPMSESNRRQAMVPRGCEMIPNPRGTAPGIYCEVGAAAGGEGARARLWALPGVPAEMRVMFERSVAPALAPGATGPSTHIHVLRCFGITEAGLGERIADLMVRGRNPLVGTTAKDAVLTVRIIAQADSTEEASRLAAADDAEVRRRLGPAVFGSEDETLQSVVAELLTRQKKTIATAESCTGGLLAERLTEIPGGSVYFLRGYVTYSDASKIETLGVSPDTLERHGAVSEAVAREMAFGCRRTAGSDLALSITGIAGPGGGTTEKPVGLVYMGLADASGVSVKQLTFGEHLTRGEIRDRSAKAALNLLRLELL